MDQNTLAIYIHELRNLCVHTQASFDLFNNSMRNKASAGILYGGQSILVPVSQISAILWPTRARSRNRGEHLRNILQLPEKHVLNDRRVSELFERSDEKMEEWISGTKGQQVVFDFVGDPKTVGESVQSSGVYRAYDPATSVFYYRGVGYNLRALASALMDIGNRVNAAYRQLFPEQAKREDEARKKAEAARKDAEERALKAQAAGITNDAGAQGNAYLEATTDTAEKTGPKKTETEKAPAKATAPKTDTDKKTAPKKAAAKKAAPKKAAAKKTSSK